MNNNRHKIVDGLICKNCGKTYSARKQRVDIGLAIFCSMNCYHKFNAKGTNKKYIGKDNGKVSYDKIKGAYYVYWYDPETLKRKTTTFARWYWEINIGEIPDGYVASYKDKNPKNINPDNIILSSPEEIGKAIGERNKRRIISRETRKKMSLSRKGMKLSEEHKRHIGEAEKGNKNNFWIDGRSFIEYPPEFDSILKRKIRRRDRNLCRACNKYVQGKHGHIHHIDGNKLNSDVNNLLLLCDGCHKIVHMKSRTNNSIIKLLQSLLVSTI